MPEFSNAFSGLASDRKLTDKELVRAIRFMIAAEFEAIQLYEQLSESIDNPLARKVLQDVTDEEKEHVGEFSHLLHLLAPQDEDEYREGVDEAKDYLAALQTEYGYDGSGEDPDTGEGGSCGEPCTCPVCGCRHEHQKQPGSSHEGS